MKILYFTLTLLLTGLSSVVAQTEKGRWMVGASVGNFSYSAQNGNKSFAGSISPSAGYFVANNLVVGTGIPLGLSTNNYYDPTGEIHASTINMGVSPYVFYYFGSSKLKPYVGVSYTYSKTEHRIRSGSQTNTDNGYTSSVIPTVGVAYFINRTVALSAGLNYVWDRYKTAYAVYDVSGNPIETPVSTSKYLSLGIGFQIFLGK